MHSVLVFSVSPLTGILVQIRVLEDLCLTFSDLHVWTTVHVCFIVDVVLKKTYLSSPVWAPSLLCVGSLAGSRCHSLKEHCIRCQSQQDESGRDEDTNGSKLTRM